MVIRYNTHFSAIEAKNYDFMSPISLPSLPFVERSLLRESPSAGFKFDLVIDREMNSFNLNTASADRRSFSTFIQNWSETRNVATGKFDQIKAKFTYFKRQIIRNRSEWQI